MAHKLNDDVRLIAIDLLPMDALAGVEFIQGDFTSDEGLAAIEAALGDNKSDLVMSDMAPNISGTKAVDQPRSMYLAELALDLARQVLKPGGVLGIIDHDSNPGADHAALHRMPVADAIAAAEAAGFSVDSSDLLRNPNDDRTQGPFAEGLRGKTDRFVLKLTKS